jgi:mono/diheme cytochrome c family protein
VPTFTLTSYTMMMRCFIGAVFLAMHTMAASSAALPVARMDAGHAVFLKVNCGKCHTGADADSGVRLDDLPLEIATTEGADRWQKVMNVLNSGEMPPAD